MAVTEDFGEIKINNEVVGTIAGLAAMEVEGISGMGGKFSFGEMLGRKDADRGVTVAIEGNRATITVEVKIEYGVNMYEAAHKLQKSVKDAVEQMTGLVVDKVNVIIKGIVVVEQEKKPEKKEKPETPKRSH
jgi:uncharacterized alkaline shock family protein YloU